MIGSLQVGIGWGADGPKSGFFPFYVGLIIVLASVRNLVAARSSMRADAGCSPNGASSPRCCTVRRSRRSIYVRADAVSSASTSSSAL